MAEHVTYTDLGVAAITLQELDALIAERDSLLKQIETWREVHLQTVERANRFFVDLAACRAVLTALVAACALDGLPPEAPERVKREVVWAQAWLAAHPEGEQDDG